MIKEGCVYGYYLNDEIKDINLISVTAISEYCDGYWRVQMKEGCILTVHWSKLIIPD